MIFFVLTGLLLMAGLLIGIRCTKDEDKELRIVIPILLFLVSSFLSLIILGLSISFPPEMLPENLIYKGETKLASSTNYLFENAGNINNSRFFLTMNKSTLDYKYIDENRNEQSVRASGILYGSPRIYIVQSTEYDEVTLQEYVLKNTFWYSNLLDVPRYCLVVPANTVEYEDTN